MLHLLHGTKIDIQKIINPEITGVGNMANVLVEQVCNIPKHSTEELFTDINQAIGVMDSVCASPTLGLYDWQKKAWAYIRNYINKE